MQAFDGEIICESEWGVYTRLTLRFPPIGKAYYGMPEADALPEAIARRA